MNKDKNHDHFWIEAESLFESYITIRGMRWRYIRRVEGFEDEDKCSPETIEKLESIIKTVKP